MEFGVYVLFATKEDHSNLKTSIKYVENESRLMHEFWASCNLID